MPFGTLLGRSSQAPCAEVPYTEAGPMDNSARGFVRSVIRRLATTTATVTRTSKKQHVY